jgi:hypothetical protein
MKPFTGVTAAMLAMTLVAGCGKRAGSLAAQNAGLFETSPFKTDWDIAMASAKTNGYVSALTHLRKIQTQNPAGEQLDAVNNTIRSLNEEMYRAANHGDISASNALVELQGMSK